MLLPPGQQLAAPGRWPVVGERNPATRAQPWCVSISGLVAQPRSWSLEELRALPTVEQVVDIHCVTRWSKPAVRFGGVPLRHLLDLCQPLAEARFLSFVARSERRHSTSLLLADALELNTLIALTCEGKPLAEVHGGPVRTVVPNRYFYKSIKWLEEIEVLAEDRPGYWEAQAGYHNTADPWRQQRYMAPTLDRQQARELLARRDFSGSDLRSLDARGHDLTGLNAHGALLRDAHFERAKLDGASFEEANLTNAHFEGASLRGVSFRNADVEGADFRGADLRGADFTGASLLAASFLPESGDTEGWGPALLDGTTRLPAASLDFLTPVQQQFVRQVLAN
jgi:DMSO/TMAO reductase YedYZ molybdopterin-dependent catalytic subunit